MGELQPSPMDCLCVRRPMIAHFGAVATVKDGSRALFSPVSPLDLSGVGTGDPGLAFYELLSTLCARLAHMSTLPCSFSDINVTTYHFDLATVSHSSLGKDHIGRQRSRVLIPIRCAPRVPSVAVGHRQAGLGPLRAASGRSQPLFGTLAHQALAAGAHHIAQARI